jgi:hypothetical protein
MKELKMKELNKKGENFYLLWEKQITRKWHYVFGHGSIYWGLPITIGVFLISSQFEIGNMSISKLLISVIVFMTGSLGYGLSQFTIEECFNLVYEDFQRLKKNIDFDQFTSNHKVRILIMDNSDKEMHLKEVLKS